jgi:aspartyl-tRNA(Asn)/glutamyl-tRNA(Gln) amidotransferase subunit A
VTNHHEVELLDLPASGLAAEYLRGSLSPVDVANAYLARIDACDGAVNAFCVVDAEVTLEAATQSQGRWRSGRSRGPLDGVPIAVKDVVTTASWPTRKGSRARSASGGLEDAPSVQRVLDAGGVLLGKTTTPEFGWKAVTDSPLTGITCNPWDLGLTAGGSSGGSAAAVAARMAPLALGTDGGGSIRIPSSFCGVTGLKPTQGLVPQYPPSPFGVVSHLGPHARSAEDARLLLACIAGTSTWDPQSARPLAREWLTVPTLPIRSVRVGFTPDLGRVEVQTDVARCVSEAVAAIQGLGASVDLLEPVGFEDPLGEFETLWYAGAARTVEKIAPEERALLDPGLLELAERGQRLTASDYLAALEARVRLSAIVDAWLTDIDVLVMPTVPIDAFEVGNNVPPSWPDTRWMTWTPFTYPFNITGHPALTIPCGLSDRGVPVGVQLVGRKFEDGRLLGVGSQLERSLEPLPWPELRGSKARPSRLITT